MKDVDYARLFQEALCKAFAARAPQVRVAYLDLATFYQEKLSGIAHLFPPNESMRAQPLERRSAPRS